jgi:hypothetical protein
MAQQDNSTERVLVKFFLEWRAGFRAQVQRHILQSHAFRLVDLLQTIHKRAALDRNTPVVLDDLRVGLKKLGSHIKLHADDVGGGVCIQSHNDPTVLTRKVDNLRVACSG